MEKVAMRDAFFDKLFELAQKDRDIIIVSADFGAKSLNKWREELPCQFINVGIAEQNMIAIASGLALAGKKPYCYAIAPFATLRCYEFLKVDVCLMNLPVVVVGVGAGLSYSDSGPTHHATEDISIMRALPNMQIVSPFSNGSAALLARVYDKPTYIKLDRGENYKPPYYVLVRDNGTEEVWALWLKPFRMGNLDGVKLIITVEEHLLAGGFGSIMAEYLVDNNIQIPLKRIGIRDEYFYKYGKREDIWDGEAELRRTIKEFNSRKTSSNVVTRAELERIRGVKKMFPERLSDNR